MSLIKWIHSESDFCFAGEKDVKRREAVRRKTAQYLLKAEALYNTYLVASESPEKSEQVSGLLIIHSKIKLITPDEVGARHPWNMRASFCHLWPGF